MNVNMDRPPFARAGRTGCTLTALALALAFLSACGTNFEDVLFQAVSAVGRTIVDAALTDIANDLAGALDGASDSASDDATTDGAGGDNMTDGTGDSPADGSTGGSLADLTGDPPAGQTSYNALGCASCHCGDASGGCALDAPSLTGSNAASLDDHLRGDATHVGGKFDLSDQEIVDLEAYLASL